MNSMVFICYRSTTAVWCWVAEGLWDIAHYYLCRCFSPDSRLRFNHDSCRLFSLISSHEGLILLLLPIKTFQVFKPAAHVENESALPAFLADICSHVFRKHLAAGQFWSLSIGNNKAAPETLYKYQMVIQNWFMTGEKKTQSEKLL